MKSVGLIVEYNPFHNGHSYHLQAAKEATNADVAIAVMSGNFLQRGEPALVSKWCRTKMALENGVDVVFELPYRFATQKAETFANGSVSILDAAGCDSLCFGSESGDIDTFFETVHFLEREQESFDQLIKLNMGTGVSYPKALSLSFQLLPDSKKYLDLSKPNNILGFQYIKAIKQQKSTIVPLTVSRKNANYHDEHFASATIASATSIRKALFSTTGEKQPIEQFVPDATSRLLKEYYQYYGMLHQWENYWPFLQFRLLHSNPEELREIYEVEEGLENRLLNFALKANNFQAFMEGIKTKRYTWTRLQRTCLHILTNTRKAEMAENPEKASYLRLLGMTEAGRDYLKKHKSHFGLPLVSKLSSMETKEITLDLKASRIYAFGLPGPLRKEMLQKDYQQPPILHK